MQMQIKSTYILTPAPLYPKKAQKKNKIVHAKIANRSIPRKEKRVPDLGVQKVQKVEVAMRRVLQIQVVIREGRVYPG